MEVDTEQPVTHPIKHRQLLRVCSCTCHCRYLKFAVEVDTERPVLIDKYLDRAVEMDVDALCDREGNVTICAIMEHIEQAGIHSGECSECKMAIADNR